MKTLIRDLDRCDSNCLGIDVFDNGEFEEIERCDECAIYGDDVEAFEALKAHVNLLYPFLSSQAITSIEAALCSLDPRQRDKRDELP